MTKYTVKSSKQYRKEYSKMERRGKDLSKLDTAIDILASGKTLPEKYEDHALKGVWFGYRDCHIEPDWILIYKIENDILILTLSRTGSHSDLFKK